MSLPVYLHLETAMLALDGLDPAMADKLRDLMDPIERALTPVEREWLSSRGEVTSVFTVFDQLRADVERLSADVDRFRKAAKDALGWTYLPCDQTISCPCCGVAWWPNYDEPNADIGDIGDNWHGPDCELYALEVAIGLGSGRKVSQGVQCDDRRNMHPDHPDAVRIREQWVSLHALLRVFAEAGPFDEDGDCTYCGRVEHEHGKLPVHAETCPWTQARKEVGL